MDTKTLLHSLKENQVKFVIIGATAGIAHGYSRLTQDLDLFVEPTKENFRRLFKALDNFGYDLSETSVEEAVKKKLLFRGYLLRTDIHPSVKGISWDELWKRKKTFSFLGEEVYFSSLDDLIKMKQAAGRAKDMEDLKYLTEIKKRKVSD